MSFIYSSGKQCSIHLIENKADREINPPDIVHDQTIDGLISRINYQSDQLLQNTENLFKNLNADAATKVVLDYDNTILLQEDSIEAQKLLTNAPITQNVIGKILEDCNKHGQKQLISRFIEYYPTISQEINKVLSPDDVAFVLRAQYSILNFFNIILDYMNAENINKLYVVSNASAYLLVFGLCITANALDIINNANVLGHPIFKLLERNYLEIHSAFGVHVSPKKVAIFRSIAFTQETKNFISIGDGIDEKQSAKEIFNSGKVTNVSIYHFKFRDEDYVNFNNLINLQNCLKDLLFEKVKSGFSSRGEKFDRKRSEDFQRDN